MIGDLHAMNEVIVLRFKHHESLGIDVYDDGRTVILSADRIVAQITHWHNGRTEWTVHMVDDFEDVVVNHEEWSSREELKLLIDAFVFRVLCALENS